MSEINHLKIAKASASIGYAMGVLSGLMDTGRLTDQQKACATKAIDGLKQIELYEIVGTTQEDETNA